MKNKMQLLFEKYKTSIMYLCVSVLVTIVDIAIVYSCVEWFKLDSVLSNTIGVVVGFILHYFLSSKLVFNKSNGYVWAMLYIGVSVIGLIIADVIIWIAHDIYHIHILIAKSLSIIIPYFLMYFIRKYLYKKFGFDES